VTTVGPAPSRYGRTRCGLVTPEALGKIDGRNDKRVAACTWHASGSASTSHSLQHILTREHSASLGAGISAQGGPLEQVMTLARLCIPSRSEPAGWGMRRKCSASLASRRKQQLATWPSDLSCPPRPGACPRASAAPGSGSTESTPTAALPHAHQWLPTLSHCTMRALGPGDARQRRTGQGGWRELPNEREPQRLGHGHRGHPHHLAYNTMLTAEDPRR
jgi:hypothetical protein